ncbi:nickel pincer cofactor biosynthesis protein LarC [Granulicella sp. dw_53]|uniref:nickel pincer cofactor biosynthesis protein LarC n=1 Tax=Granulicella sp. dw_53 TaxID=2719792 RepID=UPI001BD6B059|nr:nickel pincer cofactor biosynthesis protein LarC [Granulicella sp. dw_53]
MRIAYLDCFAGISGDMFLGALLDAGVDPTVLHNATAALNLGASLKIETVDRSGISCTKVHVLEAGKLAEASHSHLEPYTHEPVQQQAQQTHTHQHQPKTQHLHKTGHAHTHEPHTHDQGHEEPHDHTHGRSLTVIRALIQSADLAAPVKQTAIRAFELLGASEAKIHNVDIEQIHFHEVGAVDAIVDIVATSAGIHALNADGPIHWHCSALNVGGGMVDCAHGRFPVPAPATADLLRGVPTYSAHIEKELVTPTGAALLRALAPTFGPQPAMSVQSIGYGAGTRNPQDFPNVLRLSIGESTDSKPETTHQTSAVTVLETALDDLSPQILATIIDRALALGAHDAMLTPVLMKKGRPGTLITILTDDAHRAALERLLLTETTTLGVRVRQDQRICLDRAHATVSTPYGDIRIKLGSMNGEILNVAPEFEDCRTAATNHNVAIKQVIQAATAAYLSSKPQ